jgi:hypothetical protein
MNESYGAEQILEINEVVCRARELSEEDMRRSKNYDSLAKQLSAVH